MPAVPASSAATSSMVMVSTLVHAAIGMMTSTTAETRSAIKSVRRRGHRSIKTPAGSPISSHGSQVAAVSRATIAGPACRVETATSGSATVVIAEPTALVDSPIHSRPKFRVRSSPGATFDRPDPSTSASVGQPGDRGQEGFRFGWRAGAVVDVDARTGPLAEDGVPGAVDRPVRVFEREVPDGGYDDGREVRLGRRLRRGQRDQEYVLVVEAVTAHRQPLGDQPVRFRELLPHAYPHGIEGEPARPGGGPHGGTEPER